MDFFFLRHVTKPMIKFKIATPRPWDLGQDLDSLLQETGMMFQQVCGEWGKDPITRRPGFFPTCPGWRKKHVLLFHRPWCIKYHCLRLKFHFGGHSTSPASAFSCSWATLLPLWSWCSPTPLFSRGKLQYRYLSPQTEKDAEPNPASIYPPFRCVTASDTSQDWAIPTSGLDTHPSECQLPCILMKEHLSHLSEPGSTHEFTPKLHAL